MFDEVLINDEGLVLLHDLQAHLIPRENFETEDAMLRLAEDIRVRIGQGVGDNPAFLFETQLLQDGDYNSKIEKIGADKRQEWLTRIGFTAPLLAGIGVALVLKMIAEVGGDHGPSVLFVYANFIGLVVGLAIWIIQRKRLKNSPHNISFVDNMSGEITADETGLRIETPAHTTTHFWHALRKIENAPKSVDLGFDMRTINVPVSGFEDERNISRFTQFARAWAGIPKESA